MSILIQGMNLDEFLRVNNCNPTDYLPLYRETPVYYGYDVVEFNGRFKLPLVTETMPKIKQIIINPPATIIIWKDGTKTVCKSNEEYDPEVGVAMCIAKKYFGSRNQFTKAVKEAMKDFEGRTWV